VDSDPERHEHAVRTHLGAAERHDRAAVFWRERGDEERAALERRAAELERALADLERDKARVARERPIRDVQWPSDALG
jgi:hypothetical protein